MTTLLVSDLHLDPERPALVEVFERFLRVDAPSARALYVLGDLFEAWIGDDDDSVLATQVARALAALSARRVPIWFIHGNRDFLLGQTFAARAGLKLLAEGTLHEIEGTPTLLAHGDSLCTDDLAYQRFRAQSRSVEWQREFLAQPLLARREFAARARLASAAHTRDATAQIMDVTSDAVAAALRAAGVRRLIHGHTHRPAVHHLALDGQACERIVLADWYRAGSALALEADGLRWLDLQ